MELKNAKYFDCGTKASYLKTVVEHGLAHPETKDELRTYLKSLDLS